jgi:hypothetical protein
MIFGDLEVGTILSFRSAFNRTLFAIVVAQDDVHTHVYWVNWNDGGRHIMDYLNSCWCSYMVVE